MGILRFLFGDGKKPWENPYWKFYHPDRDGDASHYRDVFLFHWNRNDHFAIKSNSSGWNFNEVFRGHSEALSIYEKEHPDMSEDRRTVISRYSFDREMFYGNDLDISYSTSGADGYLFHLSDHVLKGLAKAISMPRVHILNNPHETEVWVGEGSGYLQNVVTGETIEIRPLSRSDGGSRVVIKDSQIIVNGEYFPAEYYALRRGRPQNKRQ